jgi:hypothetical protein
VPKSHVSNEDDDYAAAVAWLANVLQGARVDTSGIVLCGELVTARSSPKKVKRQT